MKIMKTGFVSMAAVLITVSAVLLIPATAFAGHTPDHAPDTGLFEKEEKCQRVGQFFFLPPWYKYLELNEDCEVVGPTAIGRDGRPVLDWARVIGRITLAVIEMLLRIGGLIAVAFVIFGGFTYLLSQGEPDKTRMAKGAIMNALIGLVIVLLSVAIVNLIANALIR